MINRNEVIEWLKNCVYDMPYCDECPYNDHVDCKHFLMKDVFELLKEQEPVKPRFADGVHYTVNKYLCGACGHHINQNSRYCEGCGRAVKWE